MVKLKSKIVPFMSYPIISTIPRMDERNERYEGYEMQQIDLQEQQQGPDVVVHGFKPTNDELNSFIDPKSAENFRKKYQNVEALLTALNTSKEKGITQKSIQERIASFGDNVLPPPKMKSFLKFLFLALKERMVILLLLAAAVTVSVGVYETISGEANAWMEGAAIIIAIAIISGVNSINDHRKQARFRKLSDTSKSLKSVKILRDGETRQVPTTELVVGDIMFVSMGDVIPCDGVLVEGHYVKTDESSMTGESDQIIKETDVSKDFFDPFMLSGTTVVDGSGRMVIIAVGKNSLQGRAMAGLSIDPPPTPLQLKLGSLAKRLATIGLVFAAVTLIALLVIFFVKDSPGDILHGLISILLVGISIIVMAIPEGLPLAVTLALAYATIHMLKDNNLVRHLSACETMGGATTICSDKTGTLTVNRMKIVQMRVFEKYFDRYSLDNIEETQMPVYTGDTIKNGIRENFDHLATNITVNSEAYEAEVVGKMQFIGSKTDIALLEWISAFGYNYKDKRNDTEIVEMIPFSSERKRMTTRIRSPTGTVVEYTKGASEIILDLCTHYISEDGEKKVATEDYKRVISDNITDFAKDSLRTICCAYKVDTFGEENDMILLSLFGIEDPLRENASASVLKCQKAGVIVRMVTGDNALTARSIARQCGIVQDESDVVIEGPDFRKLTDDQMDALLPTLRVMARSSPNDKLLLVNALKRIGETVAVTGDGANDGPALKNSDVGFSMGLSGTEVAKEASDIVLLDDNFESIVKAIMWGRAVYAGIQKFIMFQLAINISAVLITIITSVQGSLATGIPIAALTTLQILMLNLVSDSLAAMALSTDKPNVILLDRPPHKKSDHIITPDMWRMIIGQSVYQIGIGLAVYYIGPIFWGYNQLLRGTMVFNTFVYMALFNELNCRSVGRDYNIFRGITKNKFFIPLFVVGLLAQYPIVTYLGIIFDTVPLTGWLWAVCIVLGMGSLLVGALIRSIDRLFPEH